MTVSRREFIQWSAAATALAATGLDLAAAPGGKASPKKILILGGTGFLGPATIEIAQARGHQVTMFNRGKTRPGLFPGVEKLHG
ncbi:MAG TPA: twin-arginine translocation signal domain-containing protein, partial [Geothrix sp.]|nr:twin-arginine translocation signal domain-containing protein [Geothrix sp.]